MKKEDIAKFAILQHFFNEKNHLKSNELLLYNKVILILIIWEQKIKLFQLWHKKHKFCEIWNFVTKHNIHFFVQELYWPGF